MMRLCFDAVLSAEHVVDLLQIVDAQGDELGVARGCVGLLEVSFLAEIAHLNAVSRVCWRRGGNGHTSS